MSELRECPICGGNTKSEYSPAIENEYWWFKCIGTELEEGCGYSSNQATSYDEAVDNWNKRATDPRLKQAVEEMKEHILQMKDIPLNFDMRSGAIGMLNVLRKYFPYELKEDKDE